MPDADLGSSGNEGRIEFLLANPAALREFVKSAEHNADDWFALNRELVTLRADLVEALEALRDVSALGYATEQLKYLDRGIGTATPNAVWLRIRSILSKHQGEVK